MTLFRDQKRLLAILFAGTTGLIVLLDFVGTGGVVANVARLLVEWAALLTAVALLLGIVSVASSHGSRVLKRSADWGYSVVLLLAMLAVIVVGVFVPAPGTLQLPNSLAEQPIRLFFNTIYEPLASSLLALLAFFSLSAALRALRQGRAEAIVIVVVAGLVLLVQLPLISGLSFVGAALQWLNNYVALAGARGLLIGAALGTLVASVRVLLGFDQPYLDR